MWSTRRNHVPRPQSATGCIRLRPQRHHPQPAHARLPRRSRHISAGAPPTAASFLPSRLRRSSTEVCRTLTAFRIVITNGSLRPYRPDHPGGSAGARHRRRCSRDGQRIQRGPTVWAAGPRSDRGIVWESPLSTNPRLRNLGAGDVVLRHLVAVLTTGATVLAVDSRLIERRARRRRRVPRRSTARRASFVLAHTIKS
jgi:hypothetical protein